MATPNQIRTAVEARLRALLQDIVQRQQVYRAMNGRYWQGVRTHAVTPADGAATAPDLTRKVGDFEDWQTFGAQLPATVECAFQVDTYSGTGGDGYTVTVFVEVAGDVWTRTATIGPDSRRATAWQKVSATP
jgi:hypothetical protein